MRTQRAAGPDPYRFSYSRQMPRRTHEELELRRRYEARKRYRFMLLERPLGPWRESRTDAYADGIKACEATVDRHTGNVYLNVFSWVWEAEI